MQEFALAHPYLFTWICLATVGIPSQVFFHLINRKNRK